MKEELQMNETDRVLHQNRLAAIRAEIVASGLSPEVQDLMQIRIDDSDLIYSISLIEKPSADETLHAIRTIAKCLSDALSCDVRQTVRQQARLKATIIEAVQESIPMSVKDAFEKMEFCPIKQKKSSCSWLDTLKQAVSKSPLAIAIILGALLLAGKLATIASFLGF
jgi:hypothetical protein